MAQKLTVVIPCSSGERSPKDTVISVFRQGNMVNEIICVVGSDQAGNTQILEEIVSDWPEKNLIVQQLDNFKLAQGRNAGLDKASNEWIAFVDPEDWLQPLRFETDLEILDIDKTDALATSFQTVDKDFAIIDQQRLIASDDPWVKLMKGELGMSSSTLFRKSAILAAGSWSDEYGDHAIYDLLFRIMQSDGHVQIGEHSLTLHQKNEKIYSSEESKLRWGKFVFEYLSAQEKYQKRFAEQGISKA